MNKTLLFILLLIAGSSSGQIIYSQFDLRPTSESSYKVYIYSFFNLGYITGPQVKGYYMFVDDDTTTMRLFYDFSGNWPWGSSKSSDSFDVADLHTDYLKVTSCFYAVEENLRDSVMDIDDSLFYIGSDEKVNIIISQDHGSAQISAQGPMRLAAADIFNSVGQIVYHEDYYNTQQSTIDISMYSPGLYVLRVRDDQNKLYTRKFIQ